MRKRTVKISVKWLREHGVCGKALRVLRREMGNGDITVTRRRLLRAAELSLDTGWLAGRILSPAAWAAYQPKAETAKEGRDQATNPAWAAYHTAIAPAQDVYERTVAAHWVAYQAMKDSPRISDERISVSAWLAYKRATDAAEKAYDRMTRKYWLAYRKAVKPHNARCAKICASALADALGLP